MAAVLAGLDTVEADQAQDNEAGTDQPDSVAQVAQALTFPHLSQERLIELVEAAAADQPTEPAAQVAQAEAEQEATPHQTAQMPRFTEQEAEGPLARQVELEPGELDRAESSM